MPKHHLFTTGVRLPLYTAIIANHLTLPSDDLSSFFQRTIPTADSRVIQNIDEMTESSTPLLLSLDFMVLLTRQDLLSLPRQAGKPVELPTTSAKEWNTLLQGLTARQEACLKDFCLEQEGEGVGVGVESETESGEGLGWQEGDYPMDTGKSEATSCFI